MGSHFITILPTIALYAHPRLSPPIQKEKNSSVDSDEVSPPFSQGILQPLPLQRHSPCTATAKVTSRIKQELKYS